MRSAQVKEKPICLLLSTEPPSLYMSDSKARLNESRRLIFSKITVQQLPRRAHTVLINNGSQFAKRRGTELYKPHLFDVHVIGMDANIGGLNDQTISSLNQRASLAYEPNPQGRHCL